MTDFQTHGRALLGGGYLIIPIKPGRKAPALDEWQDARLGPTDLTHYPKHGVGVLCGQGAQPLAAIDVDTTDAELAQQFVRWCEHHLGATVERVGAAPKTLLVYRAAEDGWSKAASAWFLSDDKAKHRLEVLGRGQQFVAYHLHPDTGRPYSWVDLLGGLESIRASDLPVVTRAQMRDAVTEFERLAEARGLTRTSNPGRAVTVAPVDDDPLMTYAPPVGLDLADARELLDLLPAEDYDTWLRAGMALHHEYDGSDEALAAWDAWSSGAANYQSFDDLAKRWVGFGRSGHTPTTARWLLMAGGRAKKLQQAAQRKAEWSDKRNALDEAKAAIANCGDSIDLVNEVAHAAGDAAGTDLALRAELAGLIRARFKELTDTLLPIADVRAAMAGGRTDTPVVRKHRQMTEFGNAERMLDRYGGGLMYVPELDGWFRWTGVYWRRAVIGDLEHLAKETVRALPDEAKNINSDAERAEFLKFCAVSQRAIMVRNMVSLAQSDPRIVVTVGDLDAEPNLLGVSNGAVDLRTGKLLQPDRTHRITAVTAVDYDAAAPAPLFEQTVSDVFFGDADMIGFFQRLVGYALLAQPTEDVLVIPYGSGSNGKSTVLGAIRHALGDHARMASAETFLTTGAAGANAGQAREDVLRLRGARFVYVSEPDEGSELREGLIKSMTGGEPLPARGLYAKTTVEVAPTWVAFMPTNHRPIVKGDDWAIWRRLLLLPFTRDFDNDLTIEKDGDRAEALLAEAPGILAWCVRGALAYKRDGLRPPAAVRQARDDYRGDMDLLADWLAECCEISPTHVDSNARLWASWEGFARARGELRFITNSKTLTRRIQARGFSPIKDCAGIRGRGFAGLRTKQTGDFE